VAIAKTAIDVELLLRWSYMDELSKRQLSAAEGIWDKIQDYQNHGGVDSGRGAAQRYSHFGLPDPDALLIEKAVSALEEVVIDWDQSFYAIAGDLAGLISVNDLKARKPPAPPSFGWGEAGTKALKAFFGSEGQRPFHDRPRDVIMVGGLKTNVLVTSHAIKGTRPDWRDEDPMPGMTPAAKGTHAAIVGECRGKNLYSSGSYCPLAWSPSPLSVVTGRVDYAVWHQGLCMLAETLTLDKFIALPPKAPAMPWIDGSEEQSRVVPVVPNGRNDVSGWGKLPLTPHRERTAPPRRSAKAGPVRFPLAACE
jgi:hypothetical protein